LPGALTAGSPVCVFGAGVAGAGAVSAFGRRKSIQAAMKSTAPTRRMRIGGEIWLTVPHIGTCAADP
jgi:hypothetical protein